MGKLYAPAVAFLTLIVAAGLSLPLGLALDRQGNLLEADALTGNIYEFNPSGQQSTYASGIVEPFGLAFGPNGNLFAVDNEGGDSMSFSSALSAKKFSSELFFPTGIAVDAFGNVYISALGT